MDEQMTNHFPTGKRELVFGLAAVVISLFLCDFLLYGGLNLPFALMAMALNLVSWLYLVRSGCKVDSYSAVLLIFEFLVTASLLRSDDVLVKFVMLLFGLLAGNLSLSLISGKNRCCPKGITSLLDAGQALFGLGVGELPNSFGGLNDARKNAGAFGKKNMAVLTGLAVAVPILALLIPLLMRADAAFEGLLNLLPEMDLSEPVVVLILAVPVACVVYTRNVALVHSKGNRAPFPAPKAVHPATVGTVLILVATVYLVYLFSQLAYFAGGFSGILPKEFTLAEYARRGFFEMGWLSAINLAIIALAVGLTEKKEEKTPLPVKLICLFIGLVTLFFVAAASGKMLLYIGSYGLTRLRLLTQVVMVFIGITVIFVAIWLFRPKFAYMKAILLTALVIGSVVSWADVDTVVAAYNVGAYQSGALEKIDVIHLSGLGDGAVPYLHQLTQDEDSEVAKEARRALIYRAGLDKGDFRSWNLASAKADAILKEYEPYVRDFQFQVSPEGLTLDELGCPRYSTDELQTIAAFGGTIKELHDLFPMQCIRACGEGYRAVYRGSGQIAVIVFDGELNYISKDLYPLCYTKEFISEIGPGCTVDMLKEIAPMAVFGDDFVDLYTTDGYWFHFALDKSGVVTTVSTEII